MFLLQELTHKIQLSNKSFRHLVKPKMLPPHNFFLTSKEQNRLVVEVKKDWNFINRDNTIRNNIEFNNRGNINKLLMQSCHKTVQEELQEHNLQLLLYKERLKELGQISLLVPRLQITDWECRCHREIQQVLLWDLQNIAEVRETELAKSTLLNNKVKFRLKPWLLKCIVNRDRGIKLALFLQELCTTLKW